jgi:hypothetical protein
MSQLHDPEDRCFYCASDAEMSRALGGNERRTIHMDLPMTSCPHTPADAFASGTGDEA